MVGKAKPSRRCCILRHIPDLVTLTLLEVVALSATGLEEVGALLGVTLSVVLVFCSYFRVAIESGGKEARREETRRRVRALRRRQYRRLEAVQGAATRCCSFVIRLVCFPYRWYIAEPKIEETYQVRSCPCPF
jgi:hypothetical protein